MDLDNPFVEWLLETLETKGMTRQDLADKMGMQSAPLTNIVNRKKNLEGEVQEAFLNAMMLLEKKTKTLGAKIIVEDHAEEFASEVKRLTHIHESE